MRIRKKPFVRVLALVILSAMLYGSVAVAADNAETQFTPITAKEAVSEMTWGLNYVDLLMADVPHEHGNPVGYYENAPFGIAVWFWDNSFQWLSFVGLHDGKFEISVDIPNYNTNYTPSWFSELFTIGILSYVKDQPFTLSFSDSRIEYSNGTTTYLPEINQNYDEFASNGPDINEYYTYFLDFDKSVLPEPSYELDGAQFKATVTVVSVPYASMNDKVESLYMYGRERLGQDKLGDVFIEQGANVVRLPVTWTPFIDNENGFKIDTEWLDKVKEQVNYILDSGAYCIINMHNDYLNGSYVGDQWSREWMYEPHWSYVKERFSAAWKQIAEYFKDYPEKLIFEACNEPTMEWYETAPYDWSSIQTQRVNEMNQIFVDTVRTTGGYNDKRLLCLSVANYSQYDRLDGFALPKGADPQYLMAQVHTYATLEKPDYIDGENNYEYCKNDTDKLFAELSEFKERTGIPAIIGEVAMTHQLPVEDQTQRTQYYFKAAAENGVPCLWWEDSYYSTDGRHFWLYDKRAQKWGRPHIVEAIKSALNIVDPIAVTVSINGEETPIEVEDIGACNVVAAAYDSDGKMFGVTSGAISEEYTSVKLSMSVAELPDSYNIKLFILDDSNRPLTEPLSVSK